MRYTVPQFINYETKVVGPFTFGQFIFVGSIAAACFVLYFVLKNSLVLYLFIVALVMPIAFVLAIVNVGGRPIPIILLNFFRFSVGTKMYIWKKKEAPIMYIQSEMKRELERKKGGEEQETSLGIAENSQLKRIKTKLEVK